MSGETGFTIEIRERYQDVIGDQWPAVVEPQPDELLSSWLHRLAVANGVAARTFGEVLGFSGGMWSARLDLQLRRNLAAWLSARTGVASKAILAMTISRPALTPLWLPLRETAHRNRSTWIQYCPSCLADDRAPHFRRCWRLASRISCFQHDCRLRDRCPACRSGIASFDQDGLVPQHFCTRCHFDLRVAPNGSVPAAARRLERVIDDICRIETANALPSIGALVSRVLLAPTVAGDTSAKSLTGMSTSARIQLFTRLSGEPADWLVKDKDRSTTRRRHSLVMAGGIQQRISRLADFLEKQHRSPAASRFREPNLELAGLLDAYLQIRNSGGVRHDRAGSACT